MRVIFIGLGRGGSWKEGFLFEGELGPEYLPGGSRGPPYESS